MKQRLVVLVEGGQVVGLQVLPDVRSTPSIGMPAVSASLVAGPRQTRHEVMAVVPAEFKSEAARKRFHDGLLAQLKTKT